MHFLLLYCRYISKCRPPFYIIFRHVEALGFLYFLTKFLALNPSGKREKKGKIVLQQIEKRVLGAWASVSKPLEPVLGRKFHVEAGIEVQNAYLWDENLGNTKTMKNQKQKNVCIPLFSFFWDCITI